MWSIDAHDSEPDAVRVRIRRHLVTVRGPQHTDILVQPRTASDDAHRAAWGTSRIARLAGGIVIRRVPIRHPLPDVADHVVQAVRIWRVDSGGLRAAPGLDRRIDQKVASRRIDHVTP